MNYESEVGRGDDPTDLGFFIETIGRERKFFPDMTPGGLKQITRKINMERVLGKVEATAGFVVETISAIVGLAMLLSWPVYVFILEKEINPHLLAVELGVPALLTITGKLAQDNGTNIVNKTESHLSVLRKISVTTTVSLDRPRIIDADPEEEADSSLIKPQVDLPVEAAQT